MQGEDPVVGNLIVPTTFFFPNHNAKHVALRRLPRLTQPISSLNFAMHLITRSLACRADSVAASAAAVASASAFAAVVAASWAGGVLLET